MKSVGSFLVKLVKEADIILVEVTNIVNAVLQHGKTIWSKSKGKTAIFFWINA